MYRKTTFFLVINSTLAWDNPSCFRKNNLKIIEKPIMTIDDEIREEKLQYDINREAAKTSALSSSKMDRYEYVTGEVILPSNQR